MAIASGVKNSEPQTQTDSGIRRLSSMEVEYPSFLTPAMFSITREGSVEGNLDLC